MMTLLKKNELTFLHYNYVNVVLVYFRREVQRFREEALMKHRLNTITNDMAEEGTNEEPTFSPQSNRLALNSNDTLN